MKFNLKHGIFSQVQLPIHSQDQEESMTCLFNSKPTLDHPRMQLLTLQDGENTRQGQAHTWINQRDST